MLHLLLNQIKNIAKSKNISLKEIIESALRLFIDSQKKESKPFQLKKHTFKGSGLHDGIEEGNWDKIRDKIYEGRGG